VCQLARTAQFANPEFIQQQADQLFAQLAAENRLHDLARAALVDRLTHYLAEINALHPFREGNGRTQRAFLRHLAAEAGWHLDWSRVDPAVNVAASRASLVANNEQLRLLVDDLVLPL
jgi:cell filamentation protein